MSEGSAPTPRSAALTLGQAILGLEALGALFATSLVSGLVRTGEGRPTQGWIWGVGLVVAVPVAMVGVVLLGLWIGAFRIGDRIDRERAVYHDAPRAAHRVAPRRAGGGAA